ncbi:hypothetical protein D3C87_1494550 [compost metagenome]
MTQDVQLFGTLHGVGRFDVTLAYCGGLYFEVAGQLLQAIQERVAGDFFQLHRQPVAAIVNLEHLAFQLATIGEPLQATPRAGPIEQHAVWRVGVGEHLRPGHDKRAFECLGGDRGGLTFLAGQR